MFLNFIMIKCAYVEHKNEYRKVVVAEKQILDYINNLTGQIKGLTEILIENLPSEFRHKNDQLYSWKIFDEKELNLNKNDKNYKEYPDSGDFLNFKQIETISENIKILLSEQKQQKKINNKYENFIEKSFETDYFIQKTYKIITDLKVDDKKSYLDNFKRVLEENYDFLLKNDQRLYDIYNCINILHQIIEKLRLIKSYVINNEPLDSQRILKETNVFQTLKTNNLTLINFTESYKSNLYNKIKKIDKKLLTYLNSEDNCMNYFTTKFYEDFIEIVNLYITDKFYKTTPNDKKINLDKLNKKMTSCFGWMILKIHVNTLYYLSDLIDIIKEDIFDELFFTHNN